MHEEVKVGPIRHLILQSTPYCNIRCRYCYLSEESRATKKTMDPQVACDIVRYVLSTGYSTKNLHIEWHAGEPLAAGRDFYKQAFYKITQEFGSQYTFRYSIQTNGIMINDDWCNLFKEQNWEIGISVDGPDFIHNKHRRTINNHDTYNLVMRGIDCLNKHKIPFNIISVVTKDALPYPNEMYHFFKSTGAFSVGLNLEEYEGHNKNSETQSIKIVENYDQFFKKIFDLQNNDKILSIREIADVERIILSHNDIIENQCNIPFYIMSFDYQGNFSTFSPELLTIEDSEYGSFVLGNIYKDQFSDVLNSNQFKTIYRDIHYGVKKCKQTCKYFSLCGGGDPVNKLCENGTFKSTTTFHCMSRFQIPIQTYLDNHTDINHE